MSTTNGFSLARRERFLALVAVGYTVEAAAAVAGTSRQTVARWAARGRAGSDPEAVEFATRLDAIREGQAEDVIEQEPDPDEDLPEGHPLCWTTLDDPFLALDPGALAYLTDEQRAEVRAIHAKDDPDGVIDGCLAWAEWARANLQPPYQIDWRALSNGRSPYPLSSPYPPSDGGDP